MMSTVGVAARSSETPEQRALHQICTEALRQPTDGLGRPLPVSGVFSGGRLDDGKTYTSPIEQVAFIQNGRRFLPIFYLTHQDSIDGYSPTPSPSDVTALEYVRDNRLPLCFVTTQWERNFYDYSSFYTRPFETNPLLYDLTQELVTRDSTYLVDPLGPIQAWEELGEDWHDQGNIVDWQLETLYPDPPFVLILSNHEARKSYPPEADSSYRYIAAHGSSTIDDEKRRHYGDGWVARFLAMFNSFRARLPPGWQDCRFVGYRVDETSYYGRWPDWSAIWPLYTSIPEWTWGPEHRAWDGSCYESYLASYYGNSDFQVNSPQVDAGNHIPQLAEVRETKQDYWDERIFWDGWVPDGHPEDWRAWYASQGQTWNAVRYKGMIQLCMWLSCPRVVREYRNTYEARDDIGFEYLDVVLDAVDSVHENVVLRRFWRHGALVLNSAESHPYTVNIPSEIQIAERWFLLTVDLNPAQPYPTFSTEILAFALARVIGEAPNREWLVYAHSPRQARTGVVITVPGYGNITVDVSVAGSFYLVDEAAETVTAV